MYASMNLNLPRLVNPWLLSIYQKAGYQLVFLLKIQLKTFWPPRVSFLPGTEPEMLLTG